MRLLLVLLFFILVQPTFADSFNISKVSFTGSERFESKKLQDLAKLPPGKVTDKQINLAIKRLFATGYFKNIDVSQRGKKLIFRLEGYPKITKTLLDGNDNLAASEIKKVLKDNPIIYYQPSQTKQIMEALEFIYQTKGYLDAEVGHKLDLDSGAATLIFEFDEGDRFKVSEILINSDQEIDTDVILDKLQTTAYKWWSSWATGSGRLNNLFLEADRSRVLQGMLDQGYINAVVAEPRVERDEQALKVIFDVSA